MNGRGSQSLPGRALWSVRLRGASKRTRSHNTLAAKSAMLCALYALPRAAREKGAVVLVMFAHLVPRLIESAAKHTGEPAPGSHFAGLACLSFSLSRLAGRRAGLAREACAWGRRGRAKELPGSNKFPTRHSRLAQSAAPMGNSRAKKNFSTSTRLRPGDNFGQTSLSEFQTCSRLSECAPTLSACASTRIWGGRAP